MVDMFPNGSMYVVSLLLPPVELEVQLRVPPQFTLAAARVKEGEVPSFWVKNCLRRVVFQQFSGLAT